MSTIYDTSCISLIVGKYLFHGTSLSDQAVGALLLVMSLVMLISCLIVMVKILRSLLEGQMASVIQKTINSNFPGKLAFLTGETMLEVILLFHAQVYGVFTVKNKNITLGKVVQI